MKNEHGFTLTETLIAISLVVILSATGLSGWDRWQQRQRLWQTACQVRDFLVFLRNDANRHNREHTIALQSDGENACLVSSAASGCDSASPFAMKPLWPGIAMGDITPSLGFYGLRDTAWAGHIRVESRAGTWWVIVSNGGRIRLCNAAGEAGCQ
ncbi:prepilin peptidase-dependent protein [Enterobacter cloacae complex sp. P40RS]|uniref:Prepilin peptidase-dependent protein n=1 Tax=Enterobacter pasteurii TaxID=3029761 RepID=A0ABR9Q2X8_9ENTR|nr:MULTISPECIES: prepilin peptidase-dependent protein [Enterobacter cloacae complex]MBE4853111.1 prepilin peptidase-dependent protein [Enterobacter pasteurii]MBE4864190.1 prepilin peptidase-dependent protein [Enterobacter cloacae complex sp. P40C2]MBE4875394.1 prepilin peptidase-dependent protein [Enterobacter cloacae complex sp. P40C]